MNWCKWNDNWQPWSFSSVSIGVITIANFLLQYFQANSILAEVWNSNSKGRSRNYLQLISESLEDQRFKSIPTMSENPHHHHEHKQHQSLESKLLKSLDKDPLSALEKHVRKAIQRVIIYLQIAILNKLFTVNFTYLMNYQNSSMLKQIQVAGFVPRSLAPQPFLPGQIMVACTYNDLKVLAHQPKGTKSEHG